MAYVFDPNSGATFGQLRDLVLANSFSTSRYDEFVKGWLNDAVTDVCRRLGIMRGYEILSYDAEGLVTQPAAPFFHIEQVWAVSAGTATSGEQAIAVRGNYQLDPLMPEAITVVRHGTPYWYTLRRISAQAGRYPQLRLAVLPASSAGEVGVVGLQRPPIMDGDDDVTGLGADLDDAVVAFTKARAFRAEDDFEMANLWRGEYEVGLRSVVQLEDHSDGPTVVEGTWTD